MAARTKSGFSLLSLLVAVVILLALSRVMIESFVLFRKQSAQLSNRENKEFLRNYLRISLDCQQTVANRPIPCSGEEIELFRSGSGSRLVALGGSKIGKFTVKAVCTNAKEIRVQIVEGLEGDNSENLFEPGLVCP
jgi:hypothetical protein